jgi:Na+/proline symporter
MLVISMMAFMFLPRQFHIMVIENSDEQHIKQAMWQFPAYMFLLNLFVVPIALGGLLLHGGDASLADYFVIHIPLETGHPWLALLVFIGGFSASAGMVMVESVALSTMILNHLVMPLVLKLMPNTPDLSGTLVHLKRLGISLVIFLGYAYYKVIGDSVALVNIGLISFIAATQFPPLSVRAGWTATFWSGGCSESACCAPWSSSDSRASTSGPTPCSGPCSSTSAPILPPPCSPPRAAPSGSRPSNSSTSSSAPTIPTPASASARRRRSWSSST